MTNGKWSNALPMGSDINTKGKDKSPFLHQDSETLYFVSSSSDSRRGVGGTDIFYTRLERDEKGRVKKSNSVHNNSNLSAGSFKRPP
jgi:Tol biopolymer transport system component